MKNVFLVFGILLLAIFASVNSAEAALLGVNKVRLDYFDVLRGGYAEDSIVVSSGAPQDVQITLDARGEIADWLRFESEETPIIINDQSPQRIKIIAEPPSDTQVGEYEGKIVVTTGPLGEVEGNVGAAVIVAFEIQVRITVTDTQILSCAAGGFSIGDFEIGRDMPFAASVTNQGNVRLRPEFTVRIFDQSEEIEVSKIDYAHNSQILPTTTDRVEAQIESDLDPGQYWAYVSAPVCGSGEELVTFSVLERGGLSDLGELVRIENDPWAVTGDKVPVNAFFRNRGDRYVSAQFKGIVSRDGKIVETLLSDTLDVAPGETAVFEMIYEPEITGQYQISGRVVYNNKLTYEKGSMLNVNLGTGPVAENDSLLAWVLVGVIVVAGVLVFMLIRKKRRGHRKFRW